MNGKNPKILNIALCVILLISLLSVGIFLKSIQNRKDNSLVVTVKVVDKSKNFSGKSKYKEISILYKDKIYKCYFGYRNNTPYDKYKIGDLIKVKYYPNLEIFKLK